MGHAGDIFIAKAQSPEEREACFVIRAKVFIEEQKVPLSRERDGLDDSALHFLVLNKGMPIGTARVRFKDGAAKIERVAVLREARNLHIGAELMRFIEADESVRQAPAIILEAQKQVIPFYERLGYKPSGPEFMDAGIPHRHMSKETEKLPKAALG